MQFAGTQSPVRLSGTPRVMESTLFTLTSQRICEMNKQLLNLKVMQGLNCLASSLLNMRLFSPSAVSSVWWMCGLIYLSNYSIITKVTTAYDTAVCFPSSVITEGMSSFDSSALYVKWTMTNAC